MIINRLWGTHLVEEFVLSQHQKARIRMVHKDLDLELLKLPPSLSTEVNEARSQQKSSGRWRDRLSAQSHQ